MNIHQAKTHFSAYLAKLKKGETIMICNRNIPIAEMRAIPQVSAKPRPIGLAKKEFKIPPAFFEELPPEILDYFSKQK